MLSDPFSSASGLDWPMRPGRGPYPLPLDTLAFAILLSVLALLVLMLVLLRYWHPQGQRALAGYVEAAGVDLVFLAASTLLVVALHLQEPLGNRSSFALYRTVLDGYWLTFAIPIVTVGSSVHSRTRGGVPWLLPSVIVALAIFAGLFAYYYYYGIPAA